MDKMDAVCSAFTFSDGSCMGVSMGFRRHEQVANLRVNGNVLARDNQRNKHSAEGQHADLCPEECALRGIGRLEGKGSQRPKVAIDVHSPCHEKDGHSVLCN